MTAYRKAIFKNLTFFLFVLGTCLISLSCSSGNKEEGEEKTYSGPDEAVKEREAAVPAHGVGPAENVDLGPEINTTLAEAGQSLFEAKCSACHKFGQRYVGPDLAGVTERRSPAWIMNMIINPQEMTQKDPVAKKLLAEFMTQMVAQDVTQDDARALLEYFRQMDSKK